MIDQVNLIYGNNDIHCFVIIVVRFTEQFFDSTQHNPQDPRIFALYGKNFSKLPPALFVVAECDPVKDDSYGMNTCKA